MRIVDGHAHVASMRFIPRDFVKGVARTIVAQNAASAAFTVEQVQALLEAQHQDHWADDLIAEMDAAGIAQTVLLVPDFTHALKCAMPIEEMAALHHQIRQRHVGRFLVFQGIDPRSGRAALDFFERVVVEYRFNGLKLYPPCGYSPSDERLFPFYEVCRDYGLPVLLHTGPTSPVLAFNHAHPSLIDHAALMFPDVNFILAHGGVTHTTEAVQLCAYRPNVFLDFSGFPAALHPQGWAAHLQALFRIGINHKVIFGTDWPLTRMSASTQSYIDQLTRADGPMLGLAAREVEAIMAGNIERLTAESVIRSAAADAPLRRGSAG